MEVTCLAEKRRLLEETELFVLDMDGTFYLGEQILPGALDFLKEAEKKGKRYLFLRTIRRNRRSFIWKSWRGWTASSSGTRS